MTLYIEEETEVSFPFDYKELAKSVINAALDHEEFPYEVEVSLTFMDKDGIQEANRDFRQIDRPTDVLSFPMLDFPAPGDFSELEGMNDITNPETDDVVLGDIVLCVPKIYEQAEEYGHSVKREYAFLIAHSMLHLMGYDHMEDEERVEMEKRQKEILDILKIYRFEEEETNEKLN
ncbi:MAG: rRNA maturation RNase YbeY [Lachnospiraceae bacterium]|nr:rRNA maturation RNase YbeY [Lachnospiraceae bacterium]